MSLFTKLFGKKSVVELNDPVFGVITYAQGIWTFLPKTPDDGYMIGITAEEVGPSPRQREFFTQVRSNLDDYVRRARDYIAAQKDCSVNVSQLGVYSVQIEDEAATKLEEFVLELSDDAFEVHLVWFKQGQPVNYGCDD